MFLKMKIQENRVNFDKIADRLGFKLMKVPDGINKLSN